MQNLPRFVRLGAPALIVVLIGGFAIYKLFLEVEAPDEVTTDTALEQLAEDLAAEDPAAEDASAEDTPAEEPAAEDPASEDLATDAEPADEDAVAEDDATTAAPTGVVGTWVVDDDFGDFTFETASGSFAGFRVSKSLFTGQGVTAVGRTGGVTGTLEIAAGQIVAAAIAVDMTSIVSDESGRESAIRNAVNASEFPTGSFQLTTPAELDIGALEAGTTVTVDVIGDLTIAGVTNQVTIAVEATVPQAGVGLVIGTADLAWADFGVETPTSIAGTVADNGILEFQLVVRLS